MKTAPCPLCGSLHTVPAFDEKESEEVKCQTCGGWFHYYKARDGVGTRQADRMGKPEPSK